MICMNLLNRLGVKLLSLSYTNTRNRLITPMTFIVLRRKRLFVDVTPITLESAKVKITSLYKAPRAPKKAQLVTHDWGDK